MKKVTIFLFIFWFIFFNVFAPFTISYGSSDETLKEQQEEFGIQDFI